MSEYTESTEIQLLEAAILARHRLASDALATLRTEVIAESVDEIPVLLNVLRYGREVNAELKGALRTLVADLEALMEESHIELYDGDGGLVGTSWGKLLQGGKDEYLSNWRDAKRLAGGAGSEK